MYQAQLQTRTTATLQAIPDGIPGIKATLSAMKKLAVEGKRSLKVRMLALSIVAGLRSKDFVGEIKAVHAWMRNNIRYVKDILDVETLHTADKMLEIRQGDCDDHSILIASLLGSIGYPTRFVAIAMRPGQFSHVYTEVQLNKKWIAVETTENVLPGWQPRYAEKLVIEN